MAIETSSILYDGTVATTGGTATGVITKGGTLNQLNVILDDSSEFIDQTKVEFTVREPVVNTSAPNGYTQARSAVRMLVPLSLDNTNRTINSLKIELSVDHETTDAEIQSILVAGAQFLVDSDFSDFWKKQSLS
jgi:hypothetical protein